MPYFALLLMLMQMILDVTNNLSRRTYCSLAEKQLRDFPEFLRNLLTHFGMSMGQPVS